MTELADEIIIKKINQGDENLFEVLVDRYSEKLLHYVYRMIRSMDDAEDVLQDALIRIYTNLDKFDTSRSFKSWAYKITTNICIDYTRKKKKVVSLDKNYTSNENSSSTLLETIADTEKDPEKKILDEELLEELQKAVNDLPKKHKEAFILFHFDEFSYKDISETLSIPIGTVKSRLFTAYQHVYFQVKREHDTWELRILIIIFMNY